MPGKHHKPTDLTRDFVSVMVAAGAKQETIWKRLGISEKTLQKHYRQELDHGTEIANSKVAGQLFAGAMQAADDPRYLSAAMFWLKTRAGWREVQHVEHTHTRYVVSADPDTTEDTADEWLTQHSPNSHAQH